MKTLTTFTLLVFLAFSSYAQGGKKKGVQSASANKIDAALVPDAVKNAFTVPATDVRWEKHEAKGKEGKSRVRYVAIYTQDGLRTRSRFKEDGTPLSSSKYMGAQKLPAAVQAAATAKYPAAKLMGGEEFTSKKGMTYYKVRLRNGNSKITSFYNADGSEVKKDKVSDEDKETEEEGGEDN